MKDRTVGLVWGGAAALVIAGALVLYYRPRLAELDRRRSVAAALRESVIAYREDARPLALLPGTKSIPSGEETIPAPRPGYEWNGRPSGPHADNDIGFESEGRYLLDVSQTQWKGRDSNLPEFRVAAVAADLAAQIMERYPNDSRAFCLPSPNNPLRRSLSACAMVKFRHGTTFISAAYEQAPDDPSRIGNRMQVIILSHHSTGAGLSGGESILRRKPQ